MVMAASVNGHLGCFHVLTTVNSASVNIGVHVSFRSWFSAGMLGWGFLYVPAVFHSYAILHLHQILALKFSILVSICIHALLRHKLNSRPFLKSLENVFSITGQFLQLCSSVFWCPKGWLPLLPTIIYGPNHG